MNAVGLFQSALKIWNAATEFVVTIVTRNPLEEDIEGLEGLAKTIESAHTIFVGVGVSMMVLFFIMNFCASSIDAKEEIRLETVFKYLIGIVFANYIVVDSLNIIKAIFSFTINLAEAVGFEGTTFKSVSTSISKNTLLNKVDSFGFLNSLIALVIGAIFLLACVAMSFMLITMVLTRLLKILILIPLAPLALSTMAGGRLTNFSATSYIKTITGTMLEAVVIVLAITMTNSLSPGDLVNLSKGAVGISFVVLNSTEYLLIFMTTIGICGQASQVVHKTFGL